MVTCTTFRGGRGEKPSAMLLTWGPPSIGHIALQQLSIGHIALATIVKLVAEVLSLWDLPLATTGAGPAKLGWEQQAAQGQGQGREQQVGAWPGEGTAGAGPGEGMAGAGPGEGTAGAGTAGKGAGQGQQLSRGGASKQGQG